MLEPNFEKADGLGIGITIFENLKSQTIKFPQILIKENQS